MTSKIFSILNTGLIIMLVMGCSSTGEEDSGEVHHAHEDREMEIHLSDAQFSALEMKVGPLVRKNLTDVVEANGHLEVPPQNEATVTAFIGANVSSIRVIEGDDVKKGQVLAYLTHPKLTELQSQYLQAYNQQQFLEQDYQRQKKLYDSEVGSGKAFQQAQSSFRATGAEVKSYESQLRQLGMNPEKIKNGDFYDQVPLISPIEGTITQVNVKTGQYVQPETSLFEIVNIEHIHADLMVFEEDVHKVKKGQRVRFMVQTSKGKDLYATIYSVGKKFEKDPKAVHIHAEIENKGEKLIPGMYIRGQILTDSAQTLALPEDAITHKGEDYLVFKAEKEKDKWMFAPLRVIPGRSSNGWREIRLLDDTARGIQFALNNAYYLIAEMQKSEAEHSH